MCEARVHGGRVRLLLSTTNVMGIAITITIITTTDIIIIIIIAVVAKTSIL